MRELLRNRAFRRELTATLLLGAAFTVLGFLLSREAGAVALALTACLLAAQCFFARRRYRAMARLADELDRILHGGESFDLDRFSEGELSILQSELAKLLVALRERSDALKKDKLTLADSLADISHQLKTPLTSMNLAAAMLADPDLTPERRTELVRDLTRQLTRTEWLVSALLKLSRLDAGTVELQKTTFTAAQLFRAAASPLLIPFEVRGVELIADFSGEETVAGDLPWLAEALGNILKNCLEHTPAGGSVTVTALEMPLFTELAVTDTGGGIAPEDLPHIFERFYRGQNASPDSAGIGLALARTILSRSDGALTAENTSGGARFLLRFYRSTV